MTPRPSPPPARGRRSRPVDAPLLIAAGLHVGVIAGLLAWSLLAPPPPPVVAVFELVSVERPKLRPLAPKTNEAPPEKPAEARPPEAPALTPKPSPKPVPPKPAPKNVQTTPPADPTLPVKDVARENTSHTVTVSGTPSNPQLAFWASRIKRLVERSWNPPQGLEVPGPAKTVITFEVARSGKISAVTIAESSGNNLLDDLARRTILRLEQVPPIPENFPGDLLKVSYEFIYNDG